MAFHIGQRVQCVRGGWFVNDDPGVVAPVVGATYTVRSISDGIEGTHIRLAEIRNPIRDYADERGECMFLAIDPTGRTFFRPVVERKTDISIFTHMLTPETADA